MRRSPAAAIRTLDRDNRAQNEAIQQAFDRRDSRARRAEFATLAGVAAGQVAQTFQGEGFLKNPYGRAALAYSPLLLLDPPKQGTGAGALLRDPRVLGAGLIAGLAIFADRRRAGEVAKIEPTVPTTLTAGQAVTLTANLRDSRGNLVQGKTVIWESRSAATARIEGPNNDILTGLLPPFAAIAAKVDGVEHVFLVTVEPAATADEGPPPASEAPHAIESSDQGAEDATNATTGNG